MYSLILFGCSSLFIMKRCVTQLPGPSPYQLRVQDPRPPDSLALPCPAWTVSFAFPCTLETPHSHFFLSTHTHTCLSVCLPSSGRYCLARVPTPTPPPPHGPVVVVTPVDISCVGRPLRSRGRGPEGLSSPNLKSSAPPFPTLSPCSCPLSPHCCSRCHARYRGSGSRPDCDLASRNQD